MKTRKLVSLLAVTVLAFSACAADPKETVGGAVKALKEKGNYTWSTTSEMANSQFPAMTMPGLSIQRGRSKARLWSGASVKRKTKTAVDVSLLMASKSR